MTSTESIQLAKRVNESAKKSPLKAVTPIIKKYSGHRQGKIKKKLKFPRILHGGRSKQKKQIKPQLKTILPKTKAGDVIQLEPELLPCALNFLPKKFESVFENCNEQLNTTNEKASDSSPAKECNNKSNKSKLVANNKKKMKCIKNVEASLELLESDGSALREKREQAFAENYFLRVQQRLKGKDDNLYDQFLDLLCNFQSNGMSVCDLYKKIKILFHSHLDLSEDFVAFLTPEQAVECGVFMEHLLLTTMSDFLNMIDVYFSKSPQQVKKIHSVLESLATKPNVTTEYVMNTVLPLLKGNPVLRDYFVQMIPNARPPENFLTDFEEVEYPDLNSDISEDEEVVEMVHLPEVDDPFGGDLCPCKCHIGDGEKCNSHIDHCISCSVKFMNGKIFIQHGKFLKPARLVFDDHDMTYHKDRLAPKLYPKRGRKRHRNTLFKENSSPTKSCNLSSDEFKSDIEEDDKGRLKLICSKSSRINRKKSVSPKHCDKIIPRCILNESKIDFSDFEEKPVFSISLDNTFIMDGVKKLDNNKVEVSNPTNTENCDFITFFSDSVKEQSKTEKFALPGKPLDLPKLDIEDSLESTSKLLKVTKEPDKLDVRNIENGQTLRDERPVFVEKDRSHSPPVISIPESATPLFSDAKPILSLLENLDNSKDYPMILDSSDEKVVVSADESTADTVEIKSEEPSESKEEEPWKIEEDRVILQTLQVEENCEETYLKIGQNIPGRSVEDIKKRFAELMNIFYEMKAKTSKK